MLAYMLLYLLRGNLPWKFRPRTLAQSRAQYLYVAQVKAAWTGEALSAGYPSIFGAILDYARILRPNELPRYDLIRQALQHAQLGHEDSMLSHEGEQPWQSKKTNITQESISLLPTLTREDDPVIDPTLDWNTLMSPQAGGPTPSNSFPLGDFRNELALPHGERDPSLSLPEGWGGQLTEVWTLIDVKKKRYVPEDH
ncbi:hypothetical protein CALVIDRAFT_561042 [Calocera viscosa TUFC12733]|uniref:Protein kinase domain-containing protein n=1 Tax=Calocera viscosa (strain TUFC12733) TaxID=1330018 RepID=A0A167QFI5_CALVF|nr:hypothetical protein CALVIDRAFT_561042 [Calocera viscosa TUFC12733]